MISCLISSLNPARLHVRNTPHSCPHPRHADPYTAKVTRTSILSMVRRFSVGVSASNLSLIPGMYEKQSDRIAPAINDKVSADMVSLPFLWEGKPFPLRLCR